MHSQQYQIDFSSRTNDRCAMINRLRDTPLMIGGVILSHGRVNGVVELLQRLTVLAKYLPEELDESYGMEAQVVAIAARIDRRRSVSERTVRNWTRDAVDLGLIRRDVISQQYGGHQWNRYVVFFDQVLSLASAGNGRKRAETISGPRAETISGLGAENISAPDNVITREITTPPHTDQPSSEPHTDRDPWEVVVSDLIGVGMSEDGARGAVRAATGRQLTHAAVGELTEQYRELKSRDTHVTAGWLHRWISGRSSPPSRTAEPVVSQQRGDGMTRTEVAAASLRRRILVAGRRAGASIEQIEQRYAAAGV